MLTQQTHDLKNLVVKLRNDSVKDSEQVISNEKTSVINENGQNTKHADNLSADNTLGISIQNSKNKPDQVSLSSSFKSMDNYSMDGTVESENAASLSPSCFNENVTENKENNETNVKVKIDFC